MTYIINKNTNTNICYALYLIIIIKLSLLFWSAHPFDFFSFVNTIQRNILYNWNLFEYWNKGNLLIILWYPLHSLYLIFIKFFLNATDNILLLHFIYKIPFLFIDLLIGFLIYKIIFILFNNLYYSKLGFLIWFVNPIIFYIYGIHSHYELLVPFSIVLIIYGLLEKKLLILSAGFIIGFTTKYFIIILIPFILLYLFSRKYYKFILYFLIISAFGIVLSYLQFLLNHNLLSQTFNSILNLSVVNAPIGIDVLKINSLNIFSFFNYLFNPNYPIDNVNTPLLFYLANQGLKLVAIIILIHFFYRLYNIFFKKNIYNFSTLLTDIFLILIYFLVFSTNFQVHYLSWLIPFFIILSFNRSYLVFNLIGITVLGTILALKSEFGIRTFFLDIISNFSPYFLNNTQTNIKYNYGFWIIFILIITFFSFLFIKTKKIYNILNFKFYFLFITILWILLLIPFFQAAHEYFYQTLHENKLAYSRDTYHRGIINSAYNIKSINNNKIFINTQSINESLFFNELIKLNEIEKNNFQIYILIRNKSRDKYLQNILSLSQFNNCPIKEYNNFILNNIDKKRYNGFKINPNCINKNNVINLKNRGIINIDDFFIYVTNKEVNYLFLDSKISSIYIFSAVGVLYMIAMLYYGYKILLSLHEK